MPSRMGAPAGLEHSQWTRYARLMLSGGRRAQPIPVPYRTEKLNMKSKLVSAFLLSGIMLTSLAGAVEDYENNEGPPAADPRAVGGLGTAVLSAVVNANGTLARGSGASSVVKVSVGNYRVLFGRNVRSCTYVASIGLSGAVGTELDGVIDVVGDNLSVNGVFVDTSDVNGGQADRGFHLIVFCNQ